MVRSKSLYCTLCGVKSVCENSYQRKNGDFSTRCRSCQNDLAKKKYAAVPEWGLLKDIKRRCGNPRHAAYKYYGGRGIKCLISSYQEIIAAIGPRPTGMTLDRIDNNGNYEAGNLQWATRTQQSRNRRNVAMTIDLARECRRLYYEEKKRLPEIAKNVGHNLGIIWKIIFGGQWKEVDPEDFAKAVNKL